jgi:hypothetical protein
MAKSQPYTDNGIRMSRLTLAVGDQLEITYKGILHKSGADEIFLYGGYGEEWNEKILKPMQKNDTDFKVKFKLSHEGDFNFTFKDPADNWDNNSGSNYSVKVGKKRTSRTSKTSTARNSKSTTNKTSKTTKKTSTAKKAKDEKTTSTSKTTRKSAKKQKV